MNALGPIPMQELQQKRPGNKISRENSVSNEMQSIYDNLYEYNCAGSYSLFSIAKPLVDIG
jgi:hypothetical protein